MIIWSIHMGVDMICNVGGGAWWPLRVKYFHLVIKNAIKMHFGGEILLISTQLLKMP